MGVKGCAERPSEWPLSPAAPTIRGLVPVNGSAAPYLLAPVCSGTSPWRPVIYDVTCHHKDETGNKKVKPAHDCPQHDQDDARYQGVLVFEREVPGRRFPMRCRSAATTLRSSTAPLLRLLGRSFAGPFENLLDFLFVTLPAHRYRRLDRIAIGYDGSFRRFYPNTVPIDRIIHPEKRNSLSNRGSFPFPAVNAQPKRPEMYASVRSSSGLVKILLLSSNSTRNPPMLRSSLSMNAVLCETRAACCML